MPKRSADILRSKTVTQERFIKHPGGCFIHSRDVRPYYIGQWLGGAAAGIGLSVICYRGQSAECAPAFPGGADIPVCPAPEGSLSTGFFPVRTDRCAAAFGNECGYDPGAVATGGQPARPQPLAKGRGGQSISRQKDEGGRNMEKLRRRRYLPDISAEPISAKKNSNMTRREILPPHTAGESTGIIDLRYHRREMLNCWINTNSTSRSLESRDLAAAEN